MTTVVIDFGHDTTKVGLAGPAQPDFVIPTVIGEPRHRGIMINPGGPKFYVGDEAMEKRGVLNMRRPIEHDRQVDWLRMEHLWRHIFDKMLQIESHDRPMLITGLSDSLYSKERRIKLAEQTFELMHAPSAYIGMPAVLGLQATTGRSTGTVIDMGADLCQVSCVQDGAVVPDTIHTQGTTGREIDGFLYGLLAESGQELKNYLAYGYPKLLKEKFCYVALDLYKEIQDEKSRPKSTWTLPDHQEVTVELSNEKFRAPELLFYPSKEDRSIGGLHVLTYNSICKCDAAIREPMYGNVTLLGGSSNLPGLRDRLDKELQLLKPASAKMNFTVNDKHGYAVWQGGSMLTSLSTFSTLGVTKQEYEENGKDRDIFNRFVPVLSES